jgi:hypothetical protein
MILFTIFAQILVEQEHMSLGSNLHFPRVRVHITNKVTWISFVINGIY